MSGTIRKRCTRAARGESFDEQKEYFQSRGACTIVAAWPLAGFAQNPVRPATELFEANALGVPIDPSTRVDPATMPRDLGRRRSSRSA